MAGKKSQTKSDPPEKDPFSSVSSFPYASNFDKRLFETWWIFLPTFLPFLISKAILQVIHITEKDWRAWSGDDLIYLYVPIALLVTLSWYNSWTPFIRKTFLTLGKRIKPSSDRPNTDAEYLTLIREFESKLISPARIGLLLILSAFTLYVMWSTFGAPRNLAETLIAFGAGETLVALKSAYMIMFYVVSPLAWIYLISAGAHVMITTGRYLRRVPIDFEITVEPRHPDKLGGLKFLGDFCLGLSYPILIGTLLFILMTNMELNDALSRGIQVGVVFIAIPLAYVAFFAPLWEVNREMRLRKYEFYEESLGQIENAKAKIEGNMTIDKIKKKTPALKEISTWYGVDFPEWPIDRSILVKFLSPQILSVVSLFFGLGDTGFDEIIKLFSGE